MAKYRERKLTFAEELKFLPMDFRTARWSNFFTPEKVEELAEKLEKAAAALRGWKGKGMRPDARFLVRINSFVPDNDA